jgi:hypothetical protein
MTTPITKVLVVSGFLAFTALGLFAADRINRPVTAVAIAPQPGPAVLRDADDTPQPRECDPRRGVSQLCDYP